MSTTPKPLFDAEVSEGDSALDLEGIDSRRLRSMVHARVFGEELEPVRIGRYTVLKRVGQGGMGVVYAAYDTDLDRKVAVKLLNTSGVDESVQALRGRLIREAQTLAKLSHPNVIGVYDVGEHDRQVFIAMEFVDGSTVRQWLAEDKRTWREVLSLFVQAGQGLSAAHAAGIIHRDFKPDNILVGSDRRARVADFGLARATRAQPIVGELSTVPPEPGGSNVSSATWLTLPGDHMRLIGPLTPEGGVMGTPAYMPPEQHRGQVPDPRGDQFSFGVSLYESIYGELPFKAKSRRELRRAMEKGDVAPSPRGSKVPNWLRKVLLRTLRADPDQRYPSMQHVLVALSRDPAVIVRRVALGLSLVPIALTGGWLYQVNEERHAADMAAADAKARAETERARIAELGKREREDALALKEAVLMLEDDPTTALAALKRLSEGSPHWNGVARVLASEAVQLGVAEHVSALDPTWVTDALAPDGSAIVVHNASLGKMWLSDLAEPWPRPIALDTRGVPPVVVFSPDSRHLAVRAATSIHVGDVETLDFREIGRGSPEHHRLAFSPDGRVLFSWGADPDVHVWWLDGLRPPVVLGGHGGDVRELFIAAIGDGTHRVATLDGMGVVRVWDVESAEAREVPGGGPIALSSNGRQLATTMPTTQVWVRDLVTDEARAIAQFEEPASSLRFSNNGETLAIGTSLGRVSAVSLPDGQVRTQAAHTEAVLDLGFAYDGDLVVSRSADQSLGVWDLTSERVKRLRGHTEVGFWTEASPGTLVTVGWERVIRRWRLTRSAPPLHLSDAPVTHVVWVPDGSGWIAADQEGQVTFTSTGGERPKSIVHLDERIDAIAVSEDGSMVVLGTGDVQGRVLTWDPGTQAEPREVGVTGASVMGLAVTGEDTIVATGDERIVVWDAAHPNGSVTATRGFMPFAVHPLDDGVIRTIGQRSDRTIELRDLGSEANPPLVLGSDGAVTPDFTPDGRWLAYAGLSRAIYVWHEGDEAPTKLGQHDAQVTGVQIGEDGRVVAVVGQSGVVELWDVKSGRHRKVALHAGPMRSLAFRNPEEAWLACGGADGRVRFVSDEAPRDPSGLEAWVRGGTDLEITRSPLEEYRYPVVEE